LQNSGEGGVAASSELIDGLDAERQQRLPMPCPALETPNALTKRLDNGNGKRRIHALLQLLWCPHVPYLFILILGVNRVPAESSEGCKEPARKPRIYKPHYRRWFGEIGKIADAMFFLLFGTAMNWIFNTVALLGIHTSLHRRRSIAAAPLLLGSFAGATRHQPGMFRFQPAKGFTQSRPGRGTHVEP
jgi:hypothetical protein